MARDPPNIGNIDQYHQHFRNSAQQIKAGPLEDRSCNDKCCCILFLLITIAFVATGFYFIGNADFSAVSNDINSNMHNPPNNTSNIEIQNISPGLPVIIGMIALSVILAVVFLCLLSRFPKCMFYTMLIITVLLLVILAILFFAAQVIAGGVAILVVLLIYGCFLYCSRDQIRTGIALLQTSSNFLLQKPTVYCAPIFMLFFILIFEVFWVASLSAIFLNNMDNSGNLHADPSESSDTHSALSILWMFFHIFYSIFFYYCMVFLIATACAMWYYGIDGNYLFTGIKRIIRYHIGSFTFAALLVTVVTMARQAAEDAQRQGSGGFGLCMCLLTCCLRMVEDLLETLNHNAIIVMAVTGESYIDSAKSTISLIFENFALFVVVDLISGLATFMGILFVTGIPTLIGYFLLKQTMQNPDDPTYLSIGLAIIVFVSIMVAILFLSVLSEALSCVYIFYCFDRKFDQMGFPIANQVPDSVKKLFRGLHDNRWGENQGGFQDHGYNNQGGYNQGGYNQGGPNQGGYNPGGYNQGGYNPGAPNQGYNQGGYNPYG